jgi:opacity protein-like surface antigen
MMAILLVAALSGMWDDETFLGRGPMAGVGVAAPIGRHLSVEGEAGWSEHHRDSGYLMVDGDTASVTGRLSFAFRNSHAAVRPFVSAGASWLKSTDVLTWNGRRTTARTSMAGSEFGAGAEIKASDHWKIRPEARWTMTASDPSFTPGSLEPPLFAVRAGVTAIWAPGK